jgi:hypothetical protein
MLRTVGRLLRRHLRQSLHPARPSQDKGEIRDDGRRFHDMLDLATITLMRDLVVWKNPAPQQSLPFHSSPYVS